MFEKAQRFFVAPTAISILTLASTGFAGNLIVNGDFEDTTGWGLPGTFDCPDGWYSAGTSMKNPATVQDGTTAIGGSGTSAYMEAFKTTTTSERRQMGQAFSVTPTGAEWNLAFDIATEHPGVYPERSMQLILNPTSGSRMMFRIAESLDGTTGALEFYRGNQGSWTPLPGLESCLTLSDDLANSPLANNIAFTGHFDSATPTYDITVTNASGSVYTATGIDWYESGSAPSEGAGLAYFTLPTYNSLSGAYVVDNFVSLVDSQNILQNGDFEDTYDWGDVGTWDVPAGWAIDPTLRKNAAGIQSGATAIGGSGTSAYLPAHATTNEWERRQIVQALETPSEAEWTLDMDVASTNTGSEDLRSLNFLVLDESGDRMLFRVVGSSTGDRGDFQIYRGSANGGWTTIPGLEDTILFSDDVTTDPGVHHITISGHFEGDSPTWDCSITDPLGTTLSVTGMDWFEAGAAAFVDEGLSSITFSTLDAHGDVLIDNLMIPGLSDAIDGDLNGDGEVNSGDLDMVRGSWGTTVEPGTNGDADGDGFVGSADLDIIRGNWGASAGPASVPEPACWILLLGFCAVLLNRKSRR